MHFTKNTPEGRNLRGRSALFDFLFQRVKLGRAEKFAEGDLKRIAKLFDGDAAGVLAFAVQNAFDGGLWDSG